ncbi:hypothetical protein GCM10025870_27440 [Agromyces marinus]|uniref:Uncharacterized protein n=1 Tax=Agromyces marinus TaxID=1389020 RepID=A0ABM8H4E3_9MICO|nr:hypothetical protein GCM10025870_27440 [Agromyces marinus]
MFVSSDGFVLEGPTSNVLVRLGDVVVTPPPAAGILHGTTQRRVFAFLESLGRRVAYRDLTLDELRGADAAWLVSSVRMAAPVIEVDGHPLGADAAMTAEINDHLLGAND